MRLPEGTWFKPRERWTMNGRQWVTNGHVAIVAEAEAAEKDRGAPLSRMLADATEDIEEMPERNGWLYAGESVYDAQLVRFIMTMYPGATWRKVPGRFSPLAAFVDGQPVGLAMCVAEGADHSPCKPPVCPVCEGSKWANVCARCNGSGETECDKCGHDTDCDDCDGDGGTGTCATCGGTGTWSAPS